MGVRFPSVFSTTFVGPLPANATETVVCTTPPLTLPLDSAFVFIAWRLNMSAGATVTNLQLNVRRGTTTSGAIVGPGAGGQTIAAGNIADLAGWNIDAPGAVGSIQYSLTVVQVGATGAGAVNLQAMAAFCL